jgi:heptosyltransferase I
MFPESNQPCEHGAHGVIDILIVKLSSLGDVVQTIPVIADILKHYPNAQIDWVVEEAFAPVLETVQGIRRVIPIAQRRWNRQGLKQFLHRNTRVEKAAFLTTLQTQAYDVVLDLQGLIKSGIVTRRARLKHTPHCGTIPAYSATFANASLACGYEWPVRLCTTRHIPMPATIHAVQRTRLLCARALAYPDAIIDTQPNYLWNPSNGARAGGAKLSTVLSTIHSTVQSKRHEHSNKQLGYIVLVHGSSRADNAWALKQWQKLAQQISAQGYTVILPQSNEMEWRNAQLITEGCTGAQVLERCDILLVSQLIQHSSGVIGLDTGLSHIAVALDKRCVQIFLHDRAWRAGPLSGALAKPYQRAIGNETHPTCEQVWGQWLLSEAQTQLLI